MTMYYDCPIEAAYMVKNFGVKFQVYPYGQAVLSDFSYDTLTHHLESCLEDKEVRWKYYIHPDNLSIFEPRIGDLIHVGYGDYGELHEIGVDEGGFKSNLALGGERGLGREIMRYQTSPREIIQRDNKAFIMPKEEL
jgi:hypothetical protein